MITTTKYPSSLGVLAGLLLSGPLLVGCGEESVDGSSPYALSFSGGSYNPHEGQRLYVRVIEEASGAVVQADSAVITNGGFGFSWPGILKPAQSYRLDYFADMNSNGECEPSDDHIWSRSLSKVQQDVALEESHSTNFSPAACDSFPEKGESKYALTFSGDGFTPHEGQTLRVALVRIDQERVIQTGEALIQNGRFAFSWPSVLEAGKSYHVDFYADVNANAACDSDKDHVWRSVISQVSSAASVGASHSLSFTPVACQSF